LADVECSALTGQNVKRIFDEAIFYMLKAKIQEKDRIMAEYNPDKQAQIEKVQVDKKFGAKIKGMFQGAKKLNVKNPFKKKNDTIE